MHRFISRCLRLAAGLAILVASLLAESLYAEAPEGRETPQRLALAGLQEWANSFSTVRLEFTTKVVQSTGPEFSTLGYVTKGIWINRDSRQLHLHTFSPQGDREVGRTVLLTDGNRDYRMMYAREDSEFARPDQVSIIPHQPVPVMIVPLAGLWRPIPGAWLPRVVEEGIADIALVVEGEEGEAFDEQSAGQTVVYVDPHHAYLPSKVVLNPPPGRRTIVTEFQQSAAGIWFPRRGRHEIDNIPGSLPDIFEWEITKVEFDIDVPDSVFQPPLWKGVRVVDAFKGAQYLYGVPPSAAATAKTTAEAALQNLAPAGQPAATPPASPLLGWSRALLATSLLCLLCGIIAWVRNRHALGFPKSHPGGVNVCYADGSVRFVSSSIAESVWRAASTRAGGEVPR